MSYVTIFKIDKDGDVCPHAEGYNHHAFAPLVWEILGTKYGYLDKMTHPYFLVDPGLNELWKKWPDPKMSRLEQVLMGATFDRVWFRRETLPELIEACEWFLDEYIRKPHKTKDWRTGQMVDAHYDDRTLAGDSVHKSPGIIKALKEIYEDPTSRGAAFNCCSGVLAFWYVYDTPPRCENEDGSIVHTKDEDCAGHDKCEIFGVMRSDPCEECKGTGFHKENCSEFEWDSRPWNIDKDKEQPRGEFRGARPFELLEGMKEPGLANFGPFKGQS